MKNARILTGALTLLLVVACAPETDDANASSKTNAAEKSEATAKPEAKPKANPSKPANPADGRKFTTEEYAEAKKHLKAFCTTCHGTKGKGDGLAALALNPKPRDWTDVKWQESVTDEKLFKVIKEGGLKNGLDKMMAPNELFKDRPGGIHALVKLVRKFKGK